MLFKQLFSKALFTLLLLSVFPIYELFFAETPNKGILSAYFAFLVVHLILRPIIYSAFFIENEYTFFSYRYGKIWDNAFREKKTSKKKFARVLRYFETQKYYEAFKAIQSLRKHASNPTDQKSLNVIEGMCFTMSKQPQQAITHFTRLLAESPDDALYLSFLALNYIAVDNYTEAESACNRAIRMEPGNPWCYISQTLLSFFQGDYYSVVDYGCIAIKTGAKASILYLVLSISYFMIEAEDKSNEYAIQYYNKTQYEEAHDPRPHFSNYIEKKHRKYLRLK